MHDHDSPSIWQTAALTCPDCSGHLWPPGSVAHADGCPTERATWAAVARDLERLILSGDQSFERDLTDTDAAEMAQHIGVWPHGRRARRRYRVHVHRVGRRAIFREITEHGRLTWCNGAYLPDTDTRCAS